MRTAERPTFKLRGGKQKVLVTGAGGSMGFEYVKTLAQDVPVVALARKDEQLRRLAGIRNVIPFRGDVTDPVAIREATKDVDTVFHLAAILTLADQDPEAERVNEGGTKILAEAANGNGVRHVNLISTVGVYGMKREGRLVQEDDKKTPTGVYGRTKYAQEVILFDHSNSFTASAVRPSNVIGPRVDVWTHMMLYALNNGIALPENLQNFLKRERINIPMFLAQLASSRATFSHVDIRNVIDLSVNSAQNDKAVGQAYNAVDGNTTWDKMLQYYAAILGKRGYNHHNGISQAVLDGAGFIVSTVGQKYNLRPEVRNFLSFVLNPIDGYSSIKADRELGHPHRVSLRDSIIDTKRVVVNEGIIESKKIA